MSRFATGDRATEISITLNMYSHMFQEAKARSCEAISNASITMTRTGFEQVSSILLFSGNLRK